jgi:hypothetical protein
MPKARRSAASNNRPAKPARRSGSGAPRMEGAQFLTIDLDVRSRRSLAPLIAAWPRAYQPLNREGGAAARWMILNALMAETAEAAARNLLAHVSKLRGGALLSWKQAYRRTFDIGVRAGGPGRAFEEVQLTTGTLKRIAAVGGQLQVTVYPAEPESPDASTHTRSLRSLSRP